MLISILTKPLNKLHISEPAEEEITTETILPGQSSYTMFIRITGLADSFKPPAPNSKEYDELSLNVANSIAAQISGQKGYHGLQVNGFSQSVLYSENLLQKC